MEITKQDLEKLVTIKNKKDLDFEIENLLIKQGQNEPFIDFKIISEKQKEEIIQAIAQGLKDIVIMNAENRAREIYNNNILRIGIVYEDDQINIAYNLTFPCRELFKLFKNHNIN